MVDSQPDDDTMIDSSMTAKEYLDKAERAFGFAEKAKECAGHALSRGNTELSEYHETKRRGFYKLAIESLECAAYNAAETGDIKTSMDAFSQLIFLFASSGKIKTASKYLREALDIHPTAASLMACRLIGNY
jgi:tetratricopeptide (TPR) repeat protein